MKKISLALCFLISGGSVNAFANLPNGGSRNVCVPQNSGSFTFGLEGLYWRYSSPTLDFDPISVLSNSFFSNDQLRFKHHDYDWGFKAKIGYLIPCSGNEISLAYTYYNNDENKRAPGSFILPDVPFTGTLFVAGGAFLDPAEGILPLSEIQLPIDFVQVHREIENQTWDLDFKQSFNVGCNFRVRWFGGLRYTRLENRFNVRYEATSPGTIVADFASLPVADLFFTPPENVLADVTAVFDVTGPIRETVNVKSDFNGIGPRFGTELDYQIGGGFGIVGSLAASLLVGEIDSSIRRNFENGVVTLLADVSTGVVVDPLTTDLDVGDVLEFDPTSIAPVSQSAKSSNLTRIVPNIDAKLGLDWAYQFRCSSTRLMIEAGYMVSHYFNAVDRLAILDSLPGLRNTLDISFDGPYVGIEIAL